MCARGWPLLSDIHTSGWPFAHLMLFAVWIALQCDQSGQRRISTFGRMKGILLSFIPSFLLLILLLSAPSTVTTTVTVDGSQMQQNPSSTGEFCPFTASSPICIFYLREAVIWLQQQLGDGNMHSLENATWQGTKAWSTELWWALFCPVLCSFFFA
uniref:Uncharacterized protein n=1 Tax=Eutreptiella gymnastica TaxID=73025 RepID=A0A7S4GBD6_9EUGL